MMIKSSEECIAITCDVISVDIIANFSGAYVAEDTNGPIDSILE